MFRINSDQSIYLTRGDTAEVIVTAQSNTGTYMFGTGEVLRITVTEKKNCGKVVLQKDFAVAADTESVSIFLDSEETKFGEVISKPKEYWYEIELNPETNPKTIIGYDNVGPKVLTLLPEGSMQEEV